MNIFERTLYIVAFIWLIVYILMVIILVQGVNFGLILPEIKYIHIATVVLNFLALLALVKDILLRTFPKENDKIKWFCIVLFLWILSPYYFLKYGQKPRLN